LYILLSEREAQIVADRGFNEQVTSEVRRKVCQTIESAAPKLGKSCKTSLTRCFVRNGALAPFG
jgi:hypothetical protein